MYTHIIFRSKVKEHGMSISILEKNIIHKIGQKNSLYLDFVLLRDKFKKEGFEGSYFKRQFSYKIGDVTYIYEYVEMTEKEKKMYNSKLF